MSQSIAVELSHWRTTRFSEEQNRDMAANPRAGQPAQPEDLIDVAQVVTAYYTVEPDPGRWPWPTFTVNIVGAFLLGYFTTRLLERLPVSSYRRPLLGTGVCGGLTTFSTMQVEIIKMLEHKHYGLAVGYTAASIVAGLLALYLATTLVRRVRIRG
jgi:CrcB protein